MRDFTEQVRERRLARCYRQDDHRRRQHRHRRLRPRAGDGLPRRSKPYQRAGPARRTSSPTSTAPTSPRRSKRLDPATHAVHRRLEDLHHPGDDDQRRLGARLAARRRWATTRSRKHFVALSTNAKAVAAFGIDTANMFEFWDWVGGRYSPLVGDRPADRRCAVGYRATSSELLAGALRDGRAFPHRPARAEPAGDPGAARRLVPQLLRRPDAGDPALRPVPAPLRRLSPAGRHGEQRQVRATATASASTTPTGPIIWGEPGTNGQHAFYQLIHQGTKLDPVPTSSRRSRRHNAAAAIIRPSCSPTSSPRPRR